MLITISGLLLLVGGRHHATAAPPAAPLGVTTATITLKPVEDTFIATGRPDRNFASSAALEVAATNPLATDQSQALLRFDLSAIPAGSIIERAQLQLQQREARDTVVRTLAVDRITQGWSATAVTWNSRPPFDDMGVTFPAPAQSDRLLRVDIRPLLEGWLYQPLRYANHGLIIHSNTFAALRTFDSMEGATPPTLVIDYTPPPSQITIPLVETGSKLDAFCEPTEEYAKALRQSYIDLNGVVSTFYVKQDQASLYLCVEGTPGSFSQRYFGLYLDRDNGQEKYAEPEDYSLRVRVVDGATSAFQGTGSQTSPWAQSTVSGWQAVAAPATTERNVEVAEIKVPLAALAQTCGQPFGLAIYHQWINDNGVDYGWPTQNSPISPVTWVQAQLAQPVCPIRVCWDEPIDCQAANTARVYNVNTGAIHTVDRSGYVANRAEIADGAGLWALVPISATDAYTLYYTSGATQTVSAAAYHGDPQGVMTLVVSPANPLMLHNLTVAAQWNVDGDPLYKEELRQNLRLASDKFYDFTNGQMALGTITVYQNYENWDAADVWLFASNSMRPEAEIGGMVTTTTVDPQWDGTGDKHKLVYEPGRAYMSATWNRYGLPTAPISPTVDTSEDWAAVFAHELGHYLLFLDDTYFRYRSDFVIESVYSCTGSAMGWVYFPENTEFVFDPTHWNTNCLHTAHNDQLQRYEWATMKLWYPWLAAPVENAGPAALPAALTQVNFIAPTGAGTPVVNPLFTLDYRAGETASPAARAVIYRADRVIDQGKPSAGSTEILLHGAQEGDRLCLIDIDDQPIAPATPRNQYGCETISAGDSTLFLEKDSAWAPIMLINPVTPTIPGGTSLVISVTQATEPNLVLKARVYPEHEQTFTEVTLTGAGKAYSGQLDLPFTPAAYVQLFVDETEAPDGSDPRREALVDYGVGGSGLPGPKSKVGFAPIISSSNGRAFFVARAGLALQSGEFIALQSMAGSPPLPANTSLVDQPYRLIAYPSQLVDAGSINLRFAPLALQAAEVQDEKHYGVYYWNEHQWLPLVTTLITEPGGNLLASAPSAGAGVYAVLQTSEASGAIYLPLIQR